MGLIASSLPGRLRLRAPALRQTTARRTLADRLMSLVGALDVVENPRAGSLVLNYDAKRVDATTIERAAVGAARALGMVPSTGKPPKVVTKQARTSAPSPAKRAVSPSLRVRANRVAKRGMLGSLMVSMALAAAGSRRWHVISAGAFLAFLALHLTVHRRHVLR